MHRSLPLTASKRRSLSVAPGQLWPQCPQKLHPLLGSAPFQRSLALQRAKFLWRLRKIGAAPSTAGLSAAHILRLGSAHGPVPVFLGVQGVPRSGRSGLLDVTHDGVRCPTASRPFMLSPAACSYTCSAQSG